ncbi:hypothetical protein CQW23_10424 [Capsicum baccatum]|uniref:Uncharacterized protein n=1 Tax=Capsicum baccatum TaxID=33114 RepID=A0A2G2WZJ9_CAPBA|nr:hypothetical protein CQW23_10424 [Capsicum baccatum]
MNMDEILKNIYSYSNLFASDPTVTFTVTTVVVINSVVVAAGGSGGGDVVLSKTVDEAHLLHRTNGNATVHRRLPVEETAVSYFHFIELKHSVSGSSHSWYENKDVSLGSWFIGLDVEHIDERSLGCVTPPRSLYNNAKEGAETPNFEAREVEVNDLQAAVVQYLQFRGTGKMSNIMTRLGDCAAGELPGNSVMFGVYEALKLYFAGGMDTSGVVVQWRRSGTGTLSELGLFHPDLAGAVTSSPNDVVHR